MRFTPKSENEIASENLLAPGIYGFEIADAEDAVSKASGADMIKLTVHVFSEDGSPVTIFDYLMEKVAYKLRHAADVCGLLGKYERGALEAIDFSGKTGRCKVAVQKDKSGQFPDKNSIADYIATANAPSASRHAPANARKPVHAGAGSDLDDEVPF